MCEFSAIVLLTSLVANNSFVGTDGAWPVSGTGMAQLNCPYNWISEDDKRLEMLHELLMIHYNQVTDYRTEYEIYGSCTCLPPVVYFIRVISASAKYGGREDKVCLDKTWKKGACVETKGNRNWWLRKIG